jgi:hypothetical protein
MPKSVITEEFEAIKIALEALEPLQENQRKFAINMILSRLGVNAPSQDQGRPQRQPPANNQAPGDAEGARQFLIEKNPATDLERYVCVAYYLAKRMNTPTFSTREVTKLNGEAGGHNFSNAAATAANATRQSKLFSNAGHGKKRLTIRGERLVDALPDRQKVAEIIKSKGGKKPGMKSKKKS